MTTKTAANERNEQMKRMWNQGRAPVLIAAAVLLLQACSHAPVTQGSGEKPAAEAAVKPSSEHLNQEEPVKQAKEKTEEQKDAAPAPAPASPNETSENEAQGKSAQPIELDLALEVVAEPASIAVLVNKKRKLPENYQPPDLVFPQVPFLLPENSERRKMRAEAARALKEMFAAAKADGVKLAGVSAYRPHDYQKKLFARYVEKDGLKKALTYSAYPGTSEHETGLAIDVSGIDGKCAAESCFAGSREAEWLAQHAAEYGFIIRYPLGKEDITGYMYEPWHLRYVGLELAREITRNGLTMEEYFGAVPVESQG